MKISNNQLKTNIDSFSASPGLKLGDRSSTSTYATPASANMTVTRKLGDQDYHREIIVNAANRSYTSTPAQASPNKFMAGAISNEELDKLERRIEEFGQCNIELEDMILKLRNKVENGNNVTTGRTSIEVSIFTPGKEQNYQSREGK